MTSFIIYKIMQWINSRYILIRTYTFSDKLKTSFLYDFMYLCRSGVHTKIEMVASFLFFLSRTKYSRSPSIDFDFYKLSHSYDVVSKKIGWNWHLVTDIFYEFFSISLFKLLKSKYHQISCFVHKMVKSDMKILFPVSLFFFLYIYTLKFDIHVRPFPHP